MQALQSVLPNVGAGGGEASAVAVESALSDFSGLSEAAAADDVSAAALDGAEPSESEALLDELSSAGVSGGFDPPPQASQTAGSEADNKRNETLRK